jgi:hypothetical protein
MIRYVEEAHGVIAIPLLDPSACKSIIDYAKGLDRWEKAGVREKINEGMYETIAMPDVRSASILSIPDGAGPFQEFNKGMDSIIKPIIKQEWQLDLDEHTTPQLVRYQSGGYYQGHPDAAEDLEYRYFSVVCYLNDEFEGGNTRFPSLKYSAIPECGKTILFPAKYFHCAQPVTSGEKYILVSWVVGPAPIKWI